MSDLCSRAAILQFYCNLGFDPEYEASVVIPRIELLVPYTDLEQLLSGSNAQNMILMSYVRRAMNVLFHPGILELYPDRLNHFRPSPRIFLAPLPVCEAHTTSKDIAKVYRDDFIELLAREAKILWLSKRA